MSGNVIGWPFVTVNTDRFHRLRWVGLAAISLGVALIIMDATIVSVATPEIISSLDLTTTQVQWVQEVREVVGKAALCKAPRTDAGGQPRYSARPAGGL